MSGSHSLFCIFTFMSADCSIVSAICMSASEARARALYDSKSAIGWNFGISTSSMATGFPPLSSASCCSRSIRSFCASLTRVCTSMQSSFTLFTSRMLASPASMRLSYICRSVSLFLRRCRSMASVLFRRITSTHSSWASSRMSRRFFS